MNVNAMIFVGSLLAAPLLASLILAVPVAYRERSVKRFLGAIWLSFAGIVLPFFAFVASAALTPESKEECNFNWVCCFHLGKLALTPLVLWACVAFYGARVRNPGGPYHPWMALGLLIGVSISSVCVLLAIGAAEAQAGTSHKTLETLVIWLIVMSIPLYVTLWYLVLLLRINASLKLMSASFWRAFLASVPFWVVGLIWSRNYYLSLPDYPPKCFVVTAALRGHESLVGPLAIIDRQGGVRMANRQLLIFWRFEQIWRERLPLSHGAFRRVYDRVGPFIAGRVTNPFLADMVYLTLKPFEWFASFICRWFG